MLTFVCLSGSLTASMQSGRPPPCNRIHAERSPAFLFAVVLSCCWVVVGFSVTVLLRCCWVVVGLVLGGWIVVVVGVVVVVVVVIVSDCCRVVAVCVAVGFQQGGRPPHLQSCIRSVPFAVLCLAMDVQCPICKADEFHTVHFVVTRVAVARPIVPTPPRTVPKGPGLKLAPEIKANYSRRSILRPIDGAVGPGQWGGH